MSYISRLMFFLSNSSRPTALFRTVIFSVPPGRIVGLANSGQFLGSLLSDHSTDSELLRVAIADVTVTILLLFPFDSLGRLECEGVVLHFNV